jgi:nucleoid-associated protein YgaU
LGDALGQIVGRAAVGAAAGAIVVLTLGVVAELVRRRSPTHRVLALLDLTVPIGVRTAIVSVLALLATMTGPRPAGAEDSVRGWLGQRSPTTTTTGEPAVRPTTTSTPTSASTTPTTAPPPVRPSGPVVLIPPLIIEQPATTPTTTAPAPPPRSTPVTPPPVASTAPAKTAPSSVAPSVHVVRSGECLWSIAAGLLGPGATGAAIDAGWRRIYDANRAAIGDNPNLIHIGLVLTLPPLDARP